MGFSQITIFPETRTHTSFATKCSRMSDQVFEQTRISVCTNVFSEHIEAAMLTTGPATVKLRWVALPKFPTVAVPLATAITTRRARSCLSGCLSASRMARAALQAYSIGSGIEE